MAPKRKAVAKPNKRQVKAKPSKKTTSDPKIAAKPPSTAEDVAPSVNPSIEVSRCSEDVPNTSNPERASKSHIWGSESSRQFMVRPCQEMVTKLRKYIVETNSQDDSVKLTNYGNFSNAIDVIRRKLGDDGVQPFKGTCFGHFLDGIECDDPDVLEFNFREIGARFDRNAFNLVTGLKFSQFPSLVETRDLSDTLWDKYFSVRGTLKQKEFMTKFERYPFDETDVEDNVKVCMFYLLETMLLAGDKRKLVCRDHFKIIQSPELRERYPWGSLSYDAMVKSLCSAVNNSNTSNTYSLCGFPLAFQYPVHNRLHLTAQEKKEAYITSFFRSIAYRSYDGPPSVVEDVDDTTVDPTSEQDHSSGGVHHSMDPPGISMDPPGGTPIVHTDPVELVGGSPTIHTDPGEHSIVVYTGSLHTPPPHHALVASTSGRKFRRLVKGVTRYGRVPKKSAMLTTPYTPLQDSDTSLHPPRVNSSASTGDVPTLMYDPYRAVEAHRRTLLMDFLDDSSRRSHSVDIMVLDKSSFHTIMTSGAWLHSDESFYYRFKAHAPVIQKKYTHPSERSPSPSHDWTVDMNDDTMTNYVKGILPLLSCSWRDVDCCGDISPLYGGCLNNDWFSCNLESLGVLFPYMLAAGGFYDERPKLTFNGTLILDAFSMSRIDAALCPQQSSSLGDCGMFILLCIDYLSAGRTLDYSQDRIEFFREKYAVGVYNNEFTL
ncbi:hypothetical protein FNV43_RR15026 [Rhamnella rubrinervis]|uniref:DUF1985 domain-containing protein n=1 Tax=Rhamnella rubrinervis TaxID=2594499 RepID=A0A8K0GY88_9ROSA|nr:hypothetical protein FNV43_RR15026 [Rhamnella rubrinervis]